MTQGAAVSVVMPFKDAVGFIRESVESVLAQSLRSWELVLVDDGGTDGSDALAREFVAADPRRVRLVSHPDRVNRGIGPSRALGIDRARGDLVAFLDADDVWEPHHLADAVQLLRDHPAADMVCGRVWLWRSWLDGREEDRLSKLAFTPGALVPAPRLLAAVLRNGGFATTPCALLVRRELALGCLEDLARFPGMYEDQVMNSWLQLRGTAVMSGASSAWYRQHPASFSALLNARPEQPDGGRTAFLSWLSEHITELGVADDEVVSLVQRELEASLDRARRGDPVADRGKRIAIRGNGLIRRVNSRLERVLRPVWRRLSDQVSIPIDVQTRRVHLILSKNGADLRGDVLLLGEASLEPFAGMSSLDARPWPPPRPSVGPHQPLAALASRAYDCIVAIAEDGASAAVHPVLRHLRRALRPGGVLLYVLPGRRPDVDIAVRTVFGWDRMRDDYMQEPGPSDRPLVLLRAMVPASDR